MDKKQFLEAGKVANTHGVRGQIRITAWCDSPEFLAAFKTIYIDEKPMRVVSSGVHKSFVLCKLEGIDTVEQAIPLKNKTVYINRDDAHLADDEVFIQDIIGMDAVNVDTGALLGKVTDVLDLPAQNVYEITGEKKYLVPAVPEFVVNTDIETRKITIRLIEGLEV